MKIGSWTFNGDQVALNLYNNKVFVDLFDYWKSGTWDIVEVPAYLNYKNHTSPKETDITFWITIRRKTLFYTVNLILPTVLISFLCVLVFYLPAEAEEKVTLGISILLSLVVFLLLVSKILPPTSLVLPLIAKYMLFTFVMNTVSILVTVVIINWNFRGPRTHHMPNWIRIVFLQFMPIFLFMKRPKKTRLRWMMETPGGGAGLGPTGGPPPSFSASDLSAKFSKPASAMDTMELSDLHHPNCRANRGPTGLDRTGDMRRGSDVSESIFLTAEAYKATEAVEFIAEHLRNENEYIQKSLAWCSGFSVNVLPLVCGCCTMAWKSVGRNNEELINQLKANNVIQSRRVMDAMLRVDRANYCRCQPYHDRPQSIGFGVTISAPHMHAFALEDLQNHLVEGARVLDVGSGSGYLTACMASMTGESGRVIGIEHIPELVETARNNVLQDSPGLAARLEFVTGDGRLGCPQHAPYDVIHVGAASHTLPQPLVDQLKPGGRMLIPIGEQGGSQCMEHIDKLADGSTQRQRLLGVVYVPLTDRNSQWPSH